MSNIPRVVWNDLEALLLDDLNVMQQRASQPGLTALLGTMAVMNPLVSASGRDSGSLATPVLGATGHNYSSTVLYGLLVNPNNTGYMLVDAGAVAFYSPATLAGDESAVVVCSGSVTSTTAMPFVANAAGSIRWDFVECRPLDGVTAQVSRDVYDESTGAPSATLLDKRAEPALEFRYRTGTASAGLPTPDTGWLPIAAVHVNSGATGFAQCDVYDIRPLLSDRVRAVAEAGTYQPSRIISDNFVTQYTMTEMYWEGVCLQEQRGYLAGGQLLCNNPTALATRGTADAQGTFQGQAAHNSVSAAPADTFCALFAAFPGGYPRWSRFAQTGSPRRVQNTFGLLVQAPLASATAGAYTPALALPTTSGLASAPAYLLSATRTTNQAASTRGCVRLYRAGGIWADMVAAPDLSLSLTASNDGATGSGVLGVGTHFPSGARRLYALMWVSSIATVGPPPGVVGLWTVEDTATGTIYQVGHVRPFDTVSGAWDIKTKTLQEVVIDLQPAVGSTMTSQSRTLRIDIGETLGVRSTPLSPGDQVTSATVNLYTTGWEF
jgi:hypothetical protein